MANYHVTNPKYSEVWKVIREGADRSAAIAKTQEKAEKLAKLFSAKTGGGEVRIHKPNGGPIRDSDTVAPGKDPRRIKDKKH